MTKDFLFTYCITHVMALLLIAMAVVRWWPEKPRNRKRNSPIPGLSAHMRWFNHQSNFVREQFDPKP